MRRRFVLLALLALGALSSSAALAQPMMMDPSKMSGIPRPDPQVPAGTITVRLIRGQLSNRMPNVEVSLKGPDGKARTAKTDAEGRATFAGLEGRGPYVASAKDGDAQLGSQPIELTGQMGSRVMLVFPASGAGAPVGQAHPDKTLEPGTIVVRAEDASGNAIQGLDVVIGHARAGEQQVVELKGKTDTAGEAKFEGLDRKPTSGYLAEVIANGSRFGSKPFKLEENAGARVVLTVRQVSKDTAALQIAEGSHILAEVTDDSLQVIEVLRLRNTGSSAFDAGADGLRIPLPRDAVQIQAADGDPNLQVVGHDAIYRGPIPPGDLQIRLGFVLPYEGEQKELVQPTPIPFARVALVTQTLEGLRVSGHELVGEQRDMQGRKLTVYFGGSTTRGGDLTLRFTGLPHGDPTPRYLAAGVSILIVLVFAIYAAGGGGDRRTRLERDRRRAFDELVTVDAKLAKGEGDKASLDARRTDLMGELADIYRGLDELGGG